MKLFNFAVFVLLSAAVLPSYAFAEGSSAAGFGGLMPLLFIFVFFYFFLLRPQQKKAKEHQNLLKALKKGDRVITSGGIHATVVSVKEKTFEIKVADNVNIQVSKEAVSEALQDENAAKIPEIVKK
jgi:preprotein translocase subunit YajC